MPSHLACRSCESQGQARCSIVDRPSSMPEAACKVCSDACIDWISDTGSGDPAWIFSATSATQERHGKLPVGHVAAKQRSESGDSGAVTPRSGQRIRSYGACDNCSRQKTACRDDANGKYYPHDANSSCKRCKSAKRACKYAGAIVKVSGTDSWAKWACQSCYDSGRTCMASQAALMKKTMYPCASCYHAKQSKAETCRPHNPRIAPPSPDLLLSRGQQAVTRSQSYRMHKPNYTTSNAALNFPSTHLDTNPADAPGFNATPSALQSNYRYTTGPIPGMVASGSHSHTEDWAAYDPLLYVNDTKTGTYAQDGFADTAQAPWVSSLAPGTLDCVCDGEDPTNHQHDTADSTYPLL